MDYFQKNKGIFATTAVAGLCFASTALAGDGPSASPGGNNGNDLLVIAGIIALLAILIGAGGGSAGGNGSASGNGSLGENGSAGGNGSFGGS